MHDFLPRTGCKKHVIYTTKWSMSDDASKDQTRTKITLIFYTKKYDLYWASKQRKDRVYFLNIMY